MADPKQRFQSPGLGDVLRLQNFILSNSLPAQVYTVAKVEIFRINEKLRSPTNSRGLVLQETIVNNQGSSSPRIFPYPQLTNADYWETRLTLNEDNYGIDDYVDRWHLIMDPDFDLENPIARLPSTEYQNEDGLGWIGSVGSGTSTTAVDLGSNRVIVENGITEASSGTMTPTEAETALIEKAINTDGGFEPSGSLVGSLATIVGSIIINFTGGAGEDHIDGQKVSYFSLASSDGGATWTGTLENNTAVALAERPTSISATYSTSTNILTITVGWNVGDEPTAMKILPVFVDKWVLDATYDPNVSNAWDNLIARTDANLVATADHDFKINPTLWQASPAPIVSDYDWLVNPTEVYLDTRRWMSVTIEPRVPDNPESTRLHYAYIASGKLRYELYRIQDDGLKLRLIAQDTIDWHAENKGLFRIDTTRAPLNRAQDCYLIFYLDLPDGSTTRSPRIVLSVRDDRQSFFNDVRSRTTVF